MFKPKPPKRDRLALNILEVLLERWHPDDPRTSMKGTALVQEAFDMADLYLKLAKEKP